MIARRPNRIYSNNSPFRNISLVSLYTFALMHRHPLRHLPAGITSSPHSSCRVVRGFGCRGSLRVSTRAFIPVLPGKRCIARGFLLCKNNPPVMGGFINTAKYQAAGKKPRAGHRTTTTPDSRLYSLSGFAPYSVYSMRSHAPKNLRRSPPFGPGRTPLPRCGSRSDQELWCRGAYAGLATHHSDGKRSSYRSFPAMRESRECSEAEPRSSFRSPDHRPVCDVYARYLWLERVRRQIVRVHPIPSYPCPCRRPSPPEELCGVLRMRSHRGRWDSISSKNPPEYRWPCSHSAVPQSYP